MLVDTISSRIGKVSQFTKLNKAHVAILHSNLNSFHQVSVACLPILASDPYLKKKKKRKEKKTGRKFELDGARSNRLNKSRITRSAIAYSRLMSSISRYSKLVNGISKKIDTS